MASLDPGRTGGSGGRRPINAARKDTRLGARSVSAIGLPAGNRSAGNPIHRNNGTRSSSGTLAGPAHVPPPALHPTAHEPSTAGHVRWAHPGDGQHASDGFDNHFPGRQRSTTG